MSDSQSTGDKRENSPPPKRPAWIAGAVLVLVGIVLILRTYTGFSLENWWALFILIPAAGSLATATSLYRRNGNKFTAASRGPLVGGLVLLTVTAFFLFNLDWGATWPVLLIIAGAGVLLSSFGR